MYKTRVCHFLYIDLCTSYVTACVTQCFWLLGKGGMNLYYIISGANYVCVCLRLCTCLFIYLILSSFLERGEVPSPPPVAPILALCPLMGILASQLKSRHFFLNSFSHFVPPNIFSFVSDPLLCLLLLTS